jgi:hypothetical protein
MRELNLNDTVKVKLTEYGWGIWERAWMVLGLAPPKKKIDEDGFTAFQLWDLMHVFGATMWIGNTNIAFEKNSIFLEEPE